jgi:hypothetical protein
MMDRVLEFVLKAQMLEIGNELYQCYVPGFPSVEEIREMMQSSTMKFKVWQTVNGIMIRREA